MTKTKKSTRRTRKQILAELKEAIECSVTGHEPKPLSRAARRLLNTMPEVD